MQGAIFQQITPIQFQSQATRVLPDHDTGAQERTVNDDDYHAETTLLRVIFAVLGNVVGGTLLLACMFVLPQIVAGILR